MLFRSVSQSRYTTCFPVTIWWAMVEGVQVIGVLGVLLLAKKKELLPSLREPLEKLKKEAGFYLAETLVAEVLKASGEIEER